MNLPTSCLRLLWLPAILSISGCNPFTDKRGEAGQACLEGEVCNQGLVCVRDTCFELVDCEASPPPHCSSAGSSGQGPDYDGDGWGECCDCDEDDHDINPAAAEHCNGVDDDCDDETDEGDICPDCVDEDGDGFGINCPDGDDCDDAVWAIHPGAPEACNLTDDDCDGQTDEEIAPQPCPLNQGVCAEVQDTCLADGTWSGCDYGPDHTPDQDTRCDGLDNDCDGETDEDALILEPESGAQAADGVDNNCNGLVDEVGGVLVPHPTFAGRWIDAFEATVFQAADCTGPRFGEASDDYPAEWPVEGQATVDLYACSLPGVMPSGHLSWYRAKRACEAQGKRLCVEAEWNQACGIYLNLPYPYGIIFQEGVCNDPLGGSGAPEPAGQRAACTVGNGTFDMSGNLTEWIDEESLEVPGTWLTAGFGFKCEVCSSGDLCHDCDFENEPWDRQKIIDDAACQTRDNQANRFPKAAARDWLGARCCYEPQ